MDCIVRYDYDLSTSNIVFTLHDLNGALHMTGTKIRCSLLVIK